ncbi:hypothetical protein GE09DRAFT_1071389 [Coniochaeta sp. 2T2.1]|nr:hypothetical protein GE09DRAFT_1071389 [Coniochaeta sp. 2T2.1]
MSTTTHPNHGASGSTPLRRPWHPDSSTDTVSQDAPVDFLTSSTSEAIAALHKKWDTLSTARRKEVLRALPPFVIHNYGKAIEELVVDNLEERQALRVARGMESFAECADILGFVASALDCVVPGASAIFRLMKSIFVASKALVEIQNYLVELFIDRISSNLGLVDKYRQLFPSNPDLLSSVLDIYTVVLQIGTRAARIFYDDKGSKRS